MLAPVAVMDTSTVERHRRAEFLSDRYAMNPYFAATFPRPNFRSRIETWQLPELAANKQVSDANKILFTGSGRKDLQDIFYVRLNMHGCDRGFFG